MKLIFNFAILSLLMACSKSEQNPTLTFQTRFEQQAFSCGQAVQHQNSLWQLSQLHLYLSDFAVKNEQGEWQSLMMTSTPYQASNVALLGQSCDEGKAEQGNWQVTFTDKASLSTASDVRFKLGVPFELNHLNPLTQQSPLNVSSMFWGWQTGHKFIRLEMYTKAINNVKSEEQQQDNWLFHLGSTGCSAPSVVRAPKQACKYTNLVDVELVLTPQSNLSQQPIIIDLSSLVNGITLTSQQSCQSAGSDKSCQQLFKHLGLGNYLSNEQVLFKVNHE
jgi:uncharacterized repeat protein (TIGR04052 family)